MIVDLAVGVVGTVAYAVVGVVLMGLGYGLVDLLTPGKLGEICMQQRFHPATAVSAAMQVAVALVVCASLT